jgi:hypothetical protein
MVSLPLVTVEYSQLVRRHVSSSGVSYGFACSSNAPASETMVADRDLPDLLKR